MKKASNSIRKQMARLEAAGIVKQGVQSGEESEQVDIDYYITAVSTLLKLIQVN